MTLSSPCWPWCKLHCCSSKGRRRPISLMRTHTQYYARSEGVSRTAFAKMSSDKIFDLTAGVYFYFHSMTYSNASMCVLSPRFRNGNTRPRMTACSMFLKGYSSKRIVGLVFERVLVSVRILVHVFWKGIRPWTNTCPMYCSVYSSMSRVF